MAIPYRKAPQAAELGLAAYLDVVPAGAERVLLGAILLADGRGQPLEFVHNTVTMPGGFLWPEGSANMLGVVCLAHSLFDACRREPDLLLARPSLGPPKALAAELAPSIPFALIPEAGEDPGGWVWVNEPPSPGMRARGLCEELARRGLVQEPFDRIRKGLREVYPSFFPTQPVESDRQARRARLLAGPLR